MRTVPSNITNGIAAGNQPVLLIHVQTKKGTGTSFRWSTKDTDDFTTWAGNDYHGGVISSTPVRQMVDITNGTGKSQLGQFNFSVINPEYSGAQSLWDYLLANDKHLKGAQVTVYLITTYGSSQDEDDGMKVFKGIVRQPRQTLEEVLLECQDESHNVHCMIPQTQINETAYPNWDASGFGNPDVLGKYIPICLGEYDFLTYLYNTSAGYCYFKHDTETQYDAGDFKVWDLANNWRATSETVTAHGTDKTAVRVGAGSVTYMLDFYKDFVPYALDSGRYIGDSTDWTNEAYALDGNQATAATQAISSAYPGPWIEFSFSGLQATELNEGVFVASVKALSSITGDTNDYWLTHGDQWGPRATPEMQDNNDPPKWDATDSVVMAAMFMSSWIAQGAKITFRSSRASTDATLSFYEFVKLRWELLAFTSSQDFYMHDATGRTFGTTWDSRKTAANAQASYAEGIEGILRHELGLTTEIDTTSFDAANTALNAWSGKAYNGTVFKVAGQLLDREMSDDFIQLLCDTSGLAYLINAEGEHQLHMIESESVKDYDIEESEIAEGSFKKIDTTGWEDIFNDFVINFNKNSKTGVYQDTITMSKDSTVAISENHYYLKMRCQESYDRYGITQQMTIDADWITDSGTAWKLMDWLCYYFVLERLKCSFQGHLYDLLKTENMDIVNIKHTLTDKTSGVKYIIYESRLTNTKGKIGTAHKAIHIEDYATRSDNPI